jgi:hypothetical protein
MVSLRIALVVLALGAPGIVHADPAVLKVAVVPGNAVNLDAARVDALGQDLAEALAGALQVEAHGGLDVRRALPPEGLPPDCVAKPACIADVARRTGAQQLLFVFMADTGGGIQIDTTWLEPASGHMASRPAMDLASADADADAKAKFEAVAHQLLPDAPLRAKPNGFGVDTHLLASTPRHLTIASYATAGGAVVALGVGIGFAIATHSKYNACSAANASATGCSSSQRGTVRSDAAIADTGFALATGAAIATAILFATSGETARVVVEPSGRGVSAMLSGRF